MQLVRFELVEGNSVVVELDDSDDTYRVAGNDGLIAVARASFEAGLSGVRAAALTALNEFRDGSAPPDEVEVEFGVNLNAQAGAVIAKGGVESHLKVRLLWAGSDEQR